MAGRGRKIADAYIDVHGDLNDFSDDLRKMRGIADEAGDESGASFGDAFVSRAEKDIKRRRESLINSLYSGETIDWERAFGTFDKDGNIQNAMRRMQRTAWDVHRAGGMTEKQYAEVAKEIDTAADAMQRIREADEEHAKSLRRIKLLHQDINDQARQATRLAREEGKVLRDNAARKRTISKEELKQFDELMKQTEEKIRADDRATDREVRNLRTVLDEAKDISEWRVRYENEMRELIKREREEFYREELELLEQHKQRFEGVNSAYGLAEQKERRKEFDAMAAHRREMFEQDMQDWWDHGQEVILLEERSNTERIRRSRLFLEDFERQNVDGMKRIRTNMIRALGKDFDLNDSIRSIDWDRIVGTIQSEDFKVAREHVRDYTVELQRAGQVSQDEAARINTATERVIRTEMARHRRFQEADRDFINGARNQSIWLRILRRGVSRLQTTWQRMDSTVRVVIALILSAAGPLAVLLSGLASAATAIVSSVGMAVAALVPLGVAAGGAVLGVVMLTQAMDEIRANTPGFEDATNRIGQAWQRQIDLFANTGIGDSIRDFLNSLSDALDGVDFGTPFGNAMSGITDAFRGVVESPVFTRFLNALETDIPAAVEGFGTGLAGMSSGLMSLFTAASPFAVTLGEQFAAWGDRFSESMDRMSQDGTLDRVFTLALESLDSVMGLLGSLGDMFGTVFMQGAEHGNNMLDSLSDLIDRFTAWANTAEGQERINEWFENGERIMSALSPVVSGLATALSGLVTDESISLFEDLMSGLGEALPLLGQLLNLTSSFGFLNTIVDLFNALAGAIAPLMPSLGEFASIVRGNVATIIESLGENLSRVMTALKPVIDLFVRLFKVLSPIVVNLVVGAFEAMANIVEGVMDVFQGLWDIVAGIFTGDWSRVWEGVKTAVLGALQAVWGFINVYLIGRAFSLLRGLGGKVLGFIKSGFSGIKGFFAGLGSTIMGWLRTGFSGIGGFFSGIWSTITNAFSTAFSTLRSTVSGGISGVVGFFSNLGSRILGALSGAGRWLLDTGRNIIQGLKDGVSNAISGLLGIFTGLFDSVVNWFKDLFGIHSPSTVFSGFGGDLIQGLINGVMGMFGAIGEMVTALFDAVIGFFADIGSWLVDKGQALWNGLKDGWDAVVGGVSDIVSNLSERFTNALSAAGTWLVEKGRAIWNGLKDGWDAVVGGVSDIISNLRERFTNALSSAASWLVDKGRALWNGLKSGWDAVVGGVSGIISNLRERFSNGLSSAGSWLVSRGRSIWNGLKSGWNAVVGGVSGLVSNLRTRFRNGLSAASSWLTSRGRSIWNGLKNGWNNAVSGVSSLVSGLRRRFSNAFAGAGSWLRSAGRNIMSGLRSGIESARDGVVSAARWVGDRVSGAVRGVLGIFSPSRVMMKIGQQTWDGFIVGTEDSEGRVVRASQDLASSVTTAFEPKSMFEKGRDAALGLADGMASQRQSIEGALSVSPLATGAGINVLPAYARAAAQENGRPARQVTVAEGAVQVITPAENPEVVAGQVVDRLVLSTSL